MAKQICQTEQNIAYQKLMISKDLQSRIRKLVLLKTSYLTLYQFLMII